MYKENAPFKYDFVGSFLRPERLKKARADYAEGNITINDLTKIEDEEIKKLIAKQKAQDIMSSQTESLDAVIGILILCGDFKALSISNSITGIFFTEKKPPMALLLYPVK